MLICKQKGFRQITLFFPTCGRFAVQLIMSGMRKFLFYFPLDRDPDLDP